MFFSEHSVYDIYYTVSQKNRSATS